MKLLSTDLEIGTIVRIKDNASKFNDRAGHSFNSKFTGKEGRIIYFGRKDTIPNK